MDNSNRSLKQGSGSRIHPSIPLSARRMALPPLPLLLLLLLIDAVCLAYSPSPRDIAGAASFCTGQTLTRLGVIDNNKRRDSNPLSSQWFKKKQRAISKKQKMTIASHWKVWGIDLLRGCAVKEIRRENYNVLEIGHGKGDFLMHLHNASSPTVNIFGCEIHRSSIAVTLDKIVSRNASNIKLIKCDITSLLLNNYITDDSLNEVYLLYPDPWYHKKDSNKRVVRGEILQSLLMKMKHNGRLFITTDSSSYRESIKDILSAPELSCFQLIREELTAPGSPPSWRIATYYENKTVSDEVFNFELRLIKH